MGKKNENRKMNLLEPPSGKDLNTLRDIAASGQKAHILFAAIDLGVFGYLTSPATVHELAEDAGTDPELTEKLLNVLTALGFLEKRQDKYANRGVARKYLVEGGQFYRGNLLELRKRGLKDWRAIVEALREEKTRKSGKEDLEHEEVFDEIFTHAHAEAAVSGPLQRAVRAVASLDEFKSAERLLDLGGGHGLYSIAFSQLNSSLDVSLFDFSHVTKIARGYLEKYGKEEEVDLIKGDFTKDDIGEGYDIVFASDVSLSEENALGKIHDSLKDNGFLAYRRWVLDRDRVSPLTSVLFDFKMAVGGSDHPVRTLEGYSEVLEAAGFSVDDVLDISVPHDPAKIMIAGRRAGV